MFLSSRDLSPLAVTAVAAAVILGCAAPSTAFAADDSPAVEALEAFRSDTKRHHAVENRFFLKENRFEISPVFGYVPNNPLAVRYAGGAILGFHFTETLALQSQITYSPDGGEGDLKGLVSVLLDRAYNASSSNGSEFQQPLDKIGLSASFGAAWAPLYGKINLFGETVLNFDFYGFAGLGLLSKHNYVATYDEAANVEAGQDIVFLQDALTPDEVTVGPVLGIGQNYFLNQIMAVKLDARATIYVDKKPQYDPEIAVTENQVYNNFMVSAGVGFFFPKMKPRLYNF